MFLDEVSRFLLVVIVCLIIFMIGIQVGMKSRQKGQPRTFEVGSEKARIEIKIS